MLVAEAISNSTSIYVTVGALVSAGLAIAGGTWAWARVTHRQESNIERISKLEREREQADAKMENHARRLDHVEWELRRALEDTQPIRVPPALPSSEGTWPPPTGR